MPRKTIIAKNEMKIAVTSQNRKTITGHAGKCRKFWTYEIDHKEIVNKTLLELAVVIKMEWHFALVLFRRIRVRSIVTPQPYL